MLLMIRGDQMAAKESGRLYVIFVQTLFLPSMIGLALGTSWLAGAVYCCHKTYQHGKFR